MVSRMHFGVLGLHW